MEKIEHTILFDTEVIFVEEKDSVYLIPKEPRNIVELRNNWKKCNFLIDIQHSGSFQSSYFVERIDFNPQKGLKLYVKYVFSEYINKNFNGFDIIGDSIDEFFSPARYFYDNRKKEQRTDLLYNHKQVDEWSINFKEKKIIIKLLYGNILQRGIASDLMLHPKLRIEFDSCNDIEFIYEVYLIIIRFLKIIRYDTKCGNLNIDLFEKKDNCISYNGKLIDYNTDNTKYLKKDYEIGYSFYQKNINNFFQFSADNTDYTFLHYPKDGLRFFGRDYNVIDFINIFSSFEYECRKQEKKYLKINTKNIKNIKKEIIDLIDSVPIEELKDEEKNFINQSKENLKNLGTEFGQKRKIVNAYNNLKEILKNSIENIFYLPEFKKQNYLEEKDIEKISKDLTKIRNKIAHGTTKLFFSEYEGKIIRFLEIMVYTQLLQRIGICEDDIEIIIGIIFKCNFKHFS